jgi:hypothetical protein
VAEIECEPTSDDDSLEPSARPVIQKTIRLYQLGTHLLGMAATATLLSINWYSAYWIDSGAAMLFEIPDQLLPQNECGYRARQRLNRALEALLEAKCSGQSGG